MELYCRHAFFNCELTSLSLDVRKGTEIDLRFFVTYILFHKTSAKNLTSIRRSTTKYSEFDTMNAPDNEGFHRCSLIIPIRSIDAMVTEFENICQFAEKIDKEHSGMVLSDEAHKSVIFN